MENQRQAKNHKVTNVIFVDWGSSTKFQICGFTEKNARRAASQLESPKPESCVASVLSNFPISVSAESSLPSRFRMLLEGKAPFSSDAQQGKSLFNGKQIFGHVHKEAAPLSVLHRQRERLPLLYPPAWPRTSTGSSEHSCPRTELSGNIFHSEGSQLPRCIYHPSEDCTISKTFSQEHCV